MTKILLVEDDKNIIDNLSELLTSEGFAVSTAGGQKEALRAIDENKYDLIILDISLPDGSGYAICSAVKADIASNINRSTPVIFLTAYDDEINAVTGLEMGAEDYITKPFRPRELVSRIKNVVRRNDKAKSTISISGITIDSLKGSVHKGDEEIFLSVLEYKLLLLFFNNPGVVMSRSRLLDEIWDIAGEFVNDNTLTVYIKRLREKIEDDPAEPAIIKTVRGIGYKLGE
ncbi:MAG: response regulator transcription factor [Eubacteriales bacterium]|nr:response regulator transcription factor [Eubacteriales bacterium]MDY3332469.1 response regulator transcription factor [Gallibacter sp.]